MLRLKKLKRGVWFSLLNDFKVLKLIIICRILFKDKPKYYSLFHLHKNN